MKRLYLLLSLTLLLQGCALGGLFSGYYEKAPMLDGNGNVVLHPLTRMPVYKITRTARSVAIMQQTASTNVDSGQSVCGEPLPADVIAKLGATGSAEYFRSRGQCQQMAMMGQVVAYATGAPTTTAGEVAREAQRAVAHAEQGMTQRVVGPLNAIADVGKVGLVVRGFNRQSDNAARVGVAAAQTGNVTTGDVFVGTQQSSSADSNDGGAIAGTELGDSAVFGEEFAPPASGSSLATGSGSGTASNSSTNGPVPFAIGNGNTIGVSQDTGRTFVDSNGTQQLDASANGGVNNDSNIDQQPIIDSNMGDQSNQPENGNNNGLF